MKHDTTWFRWGFIFCGLIVAVYMMVNLEQNAQAAPLDAPALFSAVSAEGVSTETASLSPESTDAAQQVSETTDQLIDSSEKDSPETLFVWTVRRQGGVADAVSVRDEFPQTMDVCTFEKSYRGMLIRDELEEQDLYETRIQQIDHRVIYENLPDNDVYRIPEQIEFFAETEDVVPVYGAGTIVLMRSDVTYEITGIDEYGLPNSYRATCYYRGIGEYRTLVGYSISATYRGMVKPLVDMRETIPLVPLQTFEGEQAIPAERAVVPFVEAGVAVAVGGSFLIFFWYRRRRRVSKTADNVSAEMKDVSLVDVVARILLGTRHQHT